MISVKVEPWSAIQDEIEEVAAFHWEDLALDKLLFQRDLDKKQYGLLQEMGRLEVVTARCGERLVGYAVWFVMPYHLHYQSSGPVALADMYFILKQYRKGGLGVRLFNESERVLKARGVVRAHCSCKVHEDNTRFFEMLGWSKTDYTFSKLL